MTESRVPPVARQERSRRTRRILVETGLRLLEEQGPDALTINAVSSAAGVAAGTVYRRFGDKEGLLLAVEEEFTIEFRKEIQDRMGRHAVPDDVTASGAVGVGVRAIVETFHSHEPLLRVFAVLGLREPAVLQIGSRESREGGTLFRQLLWPYRGAFTHPDAEMAIDIAYRLVYATCMHRVLNGPSMESPTTLTWDDLGAELTRTVGLMLFGRLAAGL